MTSRMPVGFIGHGNPLNVANEPLTRPWAQWAQSLPRPKAILMVSAHWEDTPVTIGSASRHTELHYDYYGFPDFMYDLTYPAPGAPEVADRVEELLSPNTAVVRSQRNLDHGAFIPLMKMWPAADIPVLEISMPVDMSEEELHTTGGELSPLRDEGVFLLATGNLVHNLRGMNWHDENAPPPEYAAGFDDWVARTLRSRDDNGLMAWTERAPDPLRNHPSAEHYRPILFAAGAARGEQPQFTVEGFEYATVGRRSVQFDEA